MGAMQQKDIEALIANARTERLQNSRQLTLGDLIRRLEALPLASDRWGEPMPEKKVIFDFCDFAPHWLDSWRGSYAELSIVPTDDYGERPTAEAFLAMLRAAVGQTFQGYKGGDYVMGADTPVWVSRHGENSYTGVVGARDAGYEIVIDTAWCEF